MGELIEIAITREEALKIVSNILIISNIVTATRFA